MASAGGMKGCNAIVTGASGGLGPAIVSELARYGVSVLATDINEVPGITLAGAKYKHEGKVIWRTCDLSSDEERMGLIDHAASKLETVHFLVNNAAFIPHGCLDQVSLDKFLLAQEVNVTAAFRLSQMVMALMPSCGGSIVNLCSNTLSGGWTDFAPYIMTKGALLGMTRALARELGGKDIRVNALSPGAIPTDAETRVFGDDLPNYERFIIEKQSLKRRGTREEIANVVRFLLSPDSSFITGQNIVVDGGVWMT